MVSQLPTHPKTEAQMAATHTKKIIHTRTILQLVALKVDDKLNSNSHIKDIEAWRDQTRMISRDTKLLSDTIRSRKVMAISSLNLKEDRVMAL